MERMDRKFSRRINYWAGVVVLAVLCVAALLAFKFFPR